jgi:hypothetical protein
MGWLSRRASKRALACLAVFGVGGIAGLVAGFSSDPVQTSELSPAEIVAMRFPGRVAPSPVVTLPSPATTGPAPASTGYGSTGYVLASAAESEPPAFDLIFSPFPTYSSAPRSAPPRAALPVQLATASVELPTQAMAYAAPEAADATYAPPDRAEPALPAARPESASLAPAKRAVQPQHPASAASGSTSASNAVLNNAQIASIRERLKLTSYQSQLWPQVESALRDISWQGHSDAAHKTAANPRGATIDPNSAPVQRLKSAAFPLIISLSEDQKQEVRTMVRLMGLENLASQF